MCVRVPTYGGHPPQVVKMDDEIRAAWARDRQAGVSSFADWLMKERGFNPANKLTLTFRQKDDQGHDLPCVSAAKAWWWWRQLVRRLNEEIGGRNYKNKFSHSYFGYVAGLEYQKNGWAHLHVVVDNYVDYQVINDWWQANCGFAWCKPVTDDGAGAVRYALKYVLKSGEVPTVWIRKIRVVVERRKLNADDQKQAAVTARAVSASSFETIEGAQKSLGLL